MEVDDRAEVASNEDQMDARVWARSRPVARERAARRLFDDERDALGPSCMKGRL
jgi:hypothetical protein